MKKVGRWIWMLDVIIILLLVIGCSVLHMEEKESGLTYRQLLLDEELSPHFGKIPNSLLGLMKRNPETKEFVLNYRKHGKDSGIEVSKIIDDNEQDLTLEDIDTDLSIEDGMLPLFVQWDERWGYEDYGDDFLAINGCGPTCLAMVRCGLSSDIEWDPYEVAKFAEDGGYYVNGVGSSWELMSVGAKAIDLTVHAIAYDETHIIEALSDGIPIICAMWPGDFTSAGHFIVLSGIDEDGDIIVRDPNSIANSEKSWSIDRLIPQIKNLWGYSYSG